MYEYLYSICTRSSAHCVFEEVRDNFTLMNGLYCLYVYSYIENIYTVYICIYKNVRKTAP